MDRKQTTIHKSSMHQQFVWRCRLDLFSRLLNGDLWKLISGERREARRLSHHCEEDWKEVSAEDRYDAHEILDRQAPTDGIRTDIAEHIHTHVHPSRTNLAYITLRDKVMNIPKCRCKRSLQANLGFHSGSICKRRQLGRFGRSRRKRPLAVNVLACSDGCADTLLMLLRGGQHQDLVDQWVRYQRIQTLGYVRNAILFSGRHRRFLALAVDSYDLVLRQKPQHPDMCEQGPITNTDQSQTNFLLILHTFLPMRVSCYRTKHAAICTCKDWIGRSDASPDKDCGNRHADQRSEFSPFERRAIGQNGSRCRAHFDGRFEDPGVGKVPA